MTIPKPPQNQQTDFTMLRKYSMKNSAASKFPMMSLMKWQAHLPNDELITEEYDKNG